MNKRAGTTGLIVAFVLAFAASPAMSAPRAASDDAQAVDKMRAAAVANAAKLLDTQGGSRIVFKVDSAALHEAVVTDLRDDLYKILREGRIPFSGLAMREGGVEVRIAEPKDRQRVLGKLVPSTETAPSGEKAVAVADSGDGLTRLTPTDFGFAERQHGLVRQSIEMIEQRLRSADIGQAGVQPDGADRIRVLLPGVRDPERATAMFAKQARLTFRLVDESMTATKAMEGSPPEGSEVLTDFKTKAPYLVLKETAVEGNDITDAAPGFDPATHQPIASFRFNAHGTRRFAQVTQDNVSKPFAIVLDDQVLSVSVIREPILGGSGVISSGNFTLEDANTMAMMLRSGTLPGRLSVVEQQVVEPAGNSGKQ
ncbi:preprotein translocase subunit SecD [Bradyrhizobium sp. Ash2021]|uniref:SecDF P1 head subdomain-containing protein n=1 Tax=Bradyrhizobium sp. Ash2021 TaxID=2954771 RepID=UPI0028167122|nr:preprotein translocase subunit SecD [Bradyrhizobium sp. Ash2021]WMT78699.1 preprotein translocase subunit SecD [Bradyrhizobium sp. Ash2021]